MVVLPIGSQIGLMLYHRTTRDMLLHGYHHSSETGQYKDIFDGSIYKRFIHNNNITNIYIGLYFDGFASTSKKAQSLGLIHTVIFNIHPTRRYQRQNMLQYTIFPGPTLPDKDNMKLYMAPLFDELSMLETNGLKINCDDGTTLEVKVHCVYISGDIPAVSSVSGLKGHTSAFPCRNCKIEKVLFSTSSYQATTATTTATRKLKYLKIGTTGCIRTKEEFLNGDPSVSL
jgi:hypothetical protein